MSASVKIYTQDNEKKSNLSFLPSLFSFNAFILATSKKARNRYLAMTFITGWMLDSFHFSWFKATFFIPRILVFVMSLCFTTYSWYICHKKRNPYNAYRSVIVRYRSNKFFFSLMLYWWSIRHTYIYFYWNTFIMKLILAEGWNKFLLKLRSLIKFLFLLFLLN